MRRSRWPASQRPTVRAERRRVRRAAGCATHHSTPGALDLRRRRSRTMGGALSSVPIGPIAATGTGRPYRASEGRDAPSLRGTPGSRLRTRRASIGRRDAEEGLPRLAWTRCRHRARETPARRGRRRPATDRLGAAPAPRRGPAAGLAAPAGRPAVPDPAARRRREHLARERRSAAGAAVQDVRGPRTGPPHPPGPRGEWRCCTKPPSTGPGRRRRSAKYGPTGPCSPKARRGITDQLPAHTPTGPTRAPTKKSTTGSEFQPSGAHPT